LSIGAALYPKDAGDPATLQANADAALYRAKADGRHMACFFHHEMDRHLRERYALQRDLRSAVAPELLDGGTQEGAQAELTAAVEALTAVRSLRVTELLTVANDPPM